MDRSPSHPLPVQSHLWYCDLSEIEIEKVWDFDFDPETDPEFDEAIYMRSSLIRCLER